MPSRTEGGLKMVAELGTATVRAHGFWKARLTAITAYAHKMLQKSCCLSKYLLKGALEEGIQSENERLRTGTEL